MYERLRRFTHGPRHDVDSVTTPDTVSSEVLRALLSVTAAATHAETGNLLGLICQELGAALRARYVCVHLDHPDTVSPETLAHGIAGCPVGAAQPSDRPRFMAAESIWGRAVRSGASRSLTTRLSDDDTLRELSHIAGFAGGLTVPLAYQDELFGTINVYTTDDGPEIDASVLASIGAVLYGAIKRQAFVSVLTRIRGTLERYLPAELVETVINAPETLATRTTIDQVTILFSDIRDFTALAEHAWPDVISELLSDHLSEMAEGVLGHQGMVDKYLGDAVMAVFGAPFPQLDHASRAFCAALEMQRRQAALSARWECRLGRKIEVGIGIHTGPVAMGNVGHERHREYAVTGDTVNVASRLKDLARAGEILVSTSALDAAGPAFAVGARSTLMIRGRTEPVTVHLLRDIGDVTTGGHRCVTA